MNYRIRNVDIVTLDDRWGTLRNSELGIADGRVAYIGQDGAGDYTGERDWEVIDGTGMICMPGLINTHNHAAMSLLRGYADDLPLQPWLNERIWPVEARMTPEDVYWGSLLAIVEMLKGGTTCFADMYFHMDEVARACRDSGIRAVLSRGLIGGRGEATDQQTLAEGLQFALEWRGQAGGRIQTMLAPHAPYTCPEPFLKTIIDAAEQHDLAIHIHLAETKVEFDEMMEQRGTTPILWVESLGLFERPVLAAHCVHVTEQDIEVLARMQGGVAHDPTGNLKLASGLAPIADMLQAGVTVALGTDGAASTNHLGMFKEIRLASLLQKNATRNAAAIPARMALQLGTREGGKAVGQPELGHLYPGGPADCILVDARKSHLTPAHDPESLLAYSAVESDVRMVWIAGELVVKDGICTRIDEQEVLRMAQRCAERITAAS